MNNQKLAEAKLNRIMQEINSGQTFLTCGKHNYVAYRKGQNASFIPPKPNGCANCWKAYYFSVHAATTPHLRQEALDELESVIRHTVEFVKKGKFDFIPELNPTVNYIKDGFIDETGEYKPNIEITDKELN